MSRSQMNCRDDSIALRLRVSHVMDCAALEPAGLPPSAILLVRRLDDPHPRAFLPYVDAIRPGRAWERAAQSRLEELHRRAARPALGFVPNSCESVLFADPGEMLACLAYDLLHGNTNISWWWQLISRTLCPGSLEGWVAAWRRQPRYVPAALRILSERRAAVELVASLSSAAASSLFSEVVREFGLDLALTSSLLMADAHLHQAQAADSEQHELASRPVLPASAEAIPAVAPPWSSVIPVALVPHTLEVTQSALLGVSLVLQYAPDAARSHRFSRHFNEWYRSAYRRPLKQTNSGADWETGHETDTQSETQLTPVVASEACREPDIAPDFTALPIADGGLTRSTGQPEMPSAAVASFSGVSEQGRVRSQDNYRGFSEDMVERAISSQLPSLIQAPLAPASVEDLHSKGPVFQRIADKVIATGLHPSSEILSKAAAAPVLREISLLIEPIPTELGGVLFLVNLMRALRLPECLETEFGVEAINGWTLLELLARCLLGPGRQAHIDDPLWTVLAGLNERRVPVGDGFAGQKRYRLPATWISQLGMDESADIGVRLCGSRLQLWHSSGFLLLDSTMDSLSAREHIEAECRSIEEVFRLRSLTHWRRVNRPAAGGCCALGMKLEAEFRRFLAFLLPYVHYRLALALGAVPNRSFNFAAELLLRRGSLYVTATHVDLVMGMAQATGPIRLSGLDADPGWIPELGRVVKFSFNPESAS
jgi:hypothetical protein